VLGLSRVGPGLLAFILVGPLLVVGYNLELFGGRMHTDVTFALAWGTFPLLTGYYAQAERLSFAALAGGTAAFGISYAQRALSTPARTLRRRVARVVGTLEMDDGTVRELNDRTLLEPLERALHALSWSMVALAVALAFTHIG
jgi:hypothetical protein